MTREEKIKQAKIDKQMDIMNVYINAAFDIQKSIKMFPKKKPFGTKGKTPLRRTKRRAPIANALLQAYMASWQIEMIKQNPLPQYECGSFPSGGICFQNEEPELIIMPNDKGYWSPNLTPNNHDM